MRETFSFALLLLTLCAYSFTFNRWGCGIRFALPIAVIAMLIMRQIWKHRRVSQVTKSVNKPIAVKVAEPEVPDEKQSEAPEVEQSKACAVAQPKAHEEVPPITHEEVQLSEVSEVDQGAQSAVAVKVSEVSEAPEAKAKLNLAQLYISACRKQHFVEAYYWLLLSDANDSDIAAEKSEVKWRWIRNGCQSEKWNERSDFTSRQSAFARAALRISTGIDEEDGWNRMKDLAAEGMYEAVHFIRVKTPYA